MFRKSMFRCVWTIGFTIFLVLVSAVFGQRQQLLSDGGFESQKNATISAPWFVEGKGFKGIDIRRGLAFSGGNNAFIRTSDREWNAIRQFVPTSPLKDYLVEAYIRTSQPFGDGYFGVRDEVGRVITEKKFGPLPTYTRLFFFFKGLPRQTGVNLFIGFWGNGRDSWIQMDDVSVTLAVLNDEQR